MSLRTRIDERLGGLRDAVERLSDLSLARRLAAGFVLFLLAFGTLVALNVLLRAGGLWGDLLFALLVTTAVLWALTRATRQLVGREKQFHAFPRAASATLFGLVGAPVALATLWEGPILLFAPIAAWAAFYARRRLRNGAGWAPKLWQWALAGVAAVLLFIVVRPPLTPEDEVPRAVPAAQLEPADVELATTFRPRLFFDSGELRYPVDVEDAIADRRLTTCRTGLSGDACLTVERAEEIDESHDYLEIVDVPSPPKGGGPGSAVYYHVVRDSERVYVDYWWFYTSNPSPVAAEVFCGPGLRTPPFTCQEHRGDWEGVTVVLAPCPAPSETCVEAGGELLRPAAVRYAQHAHVVERAWAALEEAWSSLPRPRSAALGPVWEESVLPAAADPGVRPLVFVARNSHASYARACFGGCEQEAAALPEARHDGGLPWSHNETCDGCVRPLPLTAAGEPALWSAFPGRWGAQRCILAGAYCDRSGAPRGPAFQQRYRDPGGTG